LQTLFARRRLPLRMVEQTLESTFGPRVGHEILSPRTTPRRARKMSPHQERTRDSWRACRCREGRPGGRCGPRALPRDSARASTRGA
jgi:hypothetical protein